jgi:hypothetical protein
MNHIEDLTARIGSLAPIRHALDQVVEAIVERGAKLAAEGPEWAPAPLTSAPGRGALEGPKMQTAPAANGSRSRISGLEWLGGESLTPNLNLNPEAEGEGPCLES